MTRRTLLQISAAELLACGASAQEKRPSIAFPKAPRERLAVASYPFREDIEHPGAKPAKPGQVRISLLQFPAMVVKRFQVRNIEPLSQHFVSREPAYLAALRQAQEKAGARAVNIPFSPRGSFYDPDDAKRKAAVEDARHWVDAAVAIGSPSVRAHIAGAAGVKPDAGRASESLRTLAAYGKSRNVVVNLENDDPKTEEAGFIAQIVDQVASPWLRALPDFCNSMLIGDSAYNERSLTELFHRAYNISHVKDSEVDEGKVYRADVAKIFAIARASGYRGYFSMEWEGQSDPYTGTQSLIEMSLKALA
jgi:sugar phosphate isomerase/epimerase